MNGGEDQLSLVNEERKRAAISSNQPFSKKVARPARPFITNCGTLLQIPAKKLHECNVQIKEGNRYKVTEDKDGEKNPRLECKEKLNSLERQAVRNGEEIKIEELLGEKRKSLLSMNFDKVSLKQTKGEGDNRRKDLGDMQKKKQQRPMTAEDIAMILKESDDDLSQMIVSSTDDSEDERGKGPDSESLIKTKSNKKQESSLSSGFETVPVKLKNRKRDKTSKECDSDDADDEHLVRKKKSSKATSKLKEDSEDSDPTPLSEKKCESKQNEIKKKQWEHFSDSDDEPLVKRKGRTTAQKVWKNVESSDNSEYVSPDRPKGKRPKTSEKKEQRITEGKERRAEVARSQKVSISCSEDSAEDNKLENKPVKSSIKVCNDGTGKKKNAIADMEEHSDNSDSESESSNVQKGRRHQPQRKDESSSSDDSSSKPLMGKRGKCSVTPKEKDYGSFDSHPRALTKKKLKGKRIREKSRNSDSSEDEVSVKRKRNNSEQDFKKDELEKSCCSDSEPPAAELEKSFGSDSEALAAEPKYGIIKRPRKSCSSSESDDKLVSGKRMKNAISKTSTRNITSEEIGDVSSKSKKFEEVGNERKSQKDEDDSDCESKDKGAVENGEDSRSESFSGSDTETLAKVMSSNTQKEKPEGKDRWRNSSDSDSDQEEDQKTKLPFKKVTKKSDSDSSSSDSSLNSDEEEPHKKIGKQQREKKATSKSHSVRRNVKMKSKKQNHGDDQLARLKKYIRLSGINIRNYDVLLEGCQSVKSKKEKLLQVMQDHGLKGRPTQEKCKKLKKKNDQIKELEDLDMSNIISDTGRGRRNTFSLYASQTVSHPKNDFLSPVKPSKARLIMDSDSE